MSTSPFLDAIFLQSGYNATLVGLASSLLGAISGVLGAFLVFRRRALFCDAIAHSALPGIGLAFLLMVALGSDGRNILGLFSGATISAVLGLGALHWLQTRTRLADDAAIGAVLATFYGAGVVILTAIQTTPEGNKAGLETYLLGSTSGMLAMDAGLIAGLASIILLVLLVVRRPMLMSMLDRTHATVLGVNVQRYDNLLLALVVAITVIGLKIVGLILVVALLIISPVAARLISGSFRVVAAVAAGFGAIAGYLGSAISAAAPRYPTGAVIVLILAVIFVLCAVFSIIRRSFPLFPGRLISTPGR